MLLIETVAAVNAAKTTFAVGVIDVASVVSVALYVTVWAVLSFTVKVTTPLAFEGPDAAEMTELPAPWPRVTVLPETGLPLASFKVTVTVEVDVPFALTVPGDAETVETLAETGPPWKVTLAVCVTAVDVVASVAVYVTVSALASDTVKVATPLAFVTADAGKITEDPDPAASVTVWLATGYGAVLSNIVTVIVAVLVPLSMTGLPVSATVEFEADGGPVIVNEYA
jgi:hypothetical protein